MNLLSVPPAQPRSYMTQKLTTALPRRRWVSGVLFSAAVLLSACNQQPEPLPEDPSEQTPEQIRAANETPAVMSGSAKARIDQFEPLYVAQMQSLQRRLQAEFESLQAADATDSDNPTLLDAPDTPNASDEAPEDTPMAADLDNDTAASTDTNRTNSDVAADSDEPDAGDMSIDEPNTENLDTDNETALEDEINVSTEAGERDLQVLKRISLEPRAPEILDDDTIRTRYQEAMLALYEPAATPLSAQNIDTLLNIATLIPYIFEHDEIARQLSIKSPALARIIAQHQVWEQIQAQQAANMQQMKLDQQAEFEALMTKFNETIKDYDEQIAKYEQTLEAFEE